MKRILVLADEVMIRGELARFLPGPVNLSVGEYFRQTVIEHQRCPSS